MKQTKPRRVFSDEFKRGAVRQLLGRRQLQAPANDNYISP